MSSPELHQTASDNVFRNKMLVDKILKNLDSDKDYFKLLPLRLITKKFDCEILKLIKNKCKHIEYKIGNGGYYYINGQETHHYKVLEAFRFLRNVAEIDIKSVEFDISGFSVRFHEEFMTTLILTNKESVRFLTSKNDMWCHLTPDQVCLPCRRLAPLCHEYGPMTMDVLLNSFKDPPHFKMLKITDYLIQQIAKECVNSSETRDQCLSQMRSMITPNISCDKLFITLFFLDWNIGDAPHTQPKEVLEEIMRKWCPRTIQLEFIRNPYRNISHEWRRFPLRSFTRFSFFKELHDFQTLQESSSTVEEVIVECPKLETMDEIQGGEPSLLLYVSLFKMFPSAREIFVSQILRYKVDVFLRSFLYIMADTVWEQFSENKPTLFLRLEYWKFVPNDDILIEVEQPVNEFQISLASSEVDEKFKNWRNVLEYRDPESIRQSFTMRHKLSNLELHFELVHSEMAYELIKKNPKTELQKRIYNELL
ncbi:hypothetical protein L5515_003963 [Caenorhabditis briggsae]|uniref:Uncharacterized protein n=1 Tax=Caenorhabditis briggsae TaxID=6238 RepID=A0AAE9JB63_CAEBR|nr:hypothetical protein L5515_003963 [Caenorhabditis briggsae]